MDQKDLPGYSSKHIESMFGVSRKRLYYWRKIRLLSNGIQTAGGHFRYKFIDLIAIKTIMLIKKAGISTYQIKKVALELRNQFPELELPLAEKSFYVLGKEVIVIDNNASFNPLTKQCTYIENSETKQQVINIAIQQLDIPLNIATHSTSRNQRYKVI